MGLTKVTTTLTSFEGPRGTYEAIFLVDTGVTDSMAPADQLEKIGVRREGKMSYELANGTVKEYPYGLARIQFMGETTAGRVIFGEVGFGTRPANFPVQIRGNGISKRVVTQSGGVFRFLDIPAGEYVVSASGTLPLGGSKKGEIQVKLEKKEDYNQEFVIPIE